MDCAEFIFKKFIYVSHSAVTTLVFFDVKIKFPENTPPKQTIQEEVLCVS